MNSNVRLLVLPLLTSLFATAGAAGCIDVGAMAVGTTTQVIARGSLAMKMESDYKLAQQSIPASLKTLETFHIADPNNKQLIGLLAESYCQYASAFAEDDWEIAQYEQRDFDRAEKEAERTTKMYVRCTNYGLMLLGKQWQNKLYEADNDTVIAMANKVGRKQRDALLWTAVGLGGSIYMNKGNMSLVTQAPAVRIMLERVIAIDEKHKPTDLAFEALPHMVLGMLHAEQSPALGGDLNKAAAHFAKAQSITMDEQGGARYLLANVNYAAKVLVGKQDKENFHTVLTAVLETPPSIWPEERLANEVAHRRARRYLAQEKEWF